MENKSISDFTVRKIALIDAVCHMSKSVPAGKGRAQMDFPVMVEIGLDDNSNKVVDVSVQGEVVGYTDAEDKEEEVFRILVNVVGSFLPKFSIEDSPDKKTVDGLVDVLSPLVYQYVREYIHDLARKMGISALAIPMMISNIEVEQQQE